MVSFEIMGFIFLNIFFLSMLVKSPKSANKEKIYFMCANGG